MSVRHRLVLAINFQDIQKQSKDFNFKVLLSRSPVLRCFMENDAYQYYDSLYVYTSRRNFVLLLQKYTYPYIQTYPYM